MAGPELDRMLESLGATFDAAVARAEDEAAADLALSLLQDRTLTDLVARGGAAALLVGGGTLPVERVGRDYLAAGEPPILVPAATAVVVASTDGAAPAATDGDMLSELRTWARRGGHVVVDAGDRTIAGRLLRAGRDHLVVATPRRVVLVGLGAVRSVRCGRGG